MSNKMALDARGDIRKDMPSSAYKMGDEFKPFHPGASHVRPEWRDGWNACFIAAIAALQAEPQHEAEIVRNLLWDEHPECCGCPVVGAEYMGQQELVCCGQPEPALLNDRQIVATLRAKFPALPATPPKD